jgi:3-demethylubiquinone-9 3-methyltransferase
VALAPVPGHGIVRYGNAGPGEAGKVMTVDFELEGQRFVALDGGPHFKLTEVISLYVNWETPAEVDALQRAHRGERVSPRGCRGRGSGRLGAMVSGLGSPAGAGLRAGGASSRAKGQGGVW